MTGELTAYRETEVCEHAMSSAFVAQEFRIKVMLPIRRLDGSERFPALYVSDSDEFFWGLATILDELQRIGAISRVILVAIGYGDRCTADLLRMRDLFTHSIRRRYQPLIEQLGRRAERFGQPRDTRLISESTDAREFLRFIREELMPFVASNYPTMPGECSYSGYSAGGTFGLYTLFTQPDTFKRYIIGSPGISCDGANFTAELAQGFEKTTLAANTQVFLSVGSWKNSMARTT